MRIETMNIRIILTSALLVLTSITCALSAQVDGLGLRTNLPAWILLSPSLGADISWNSRYMLVVDGSYGDWNLDQDKEGIRLSSIGVEARRYFSAGADSEKKWYNPAGGRYNGLYAGIDARYLRFNTNLSGKHREGNMYTAGVLAGYTFHTASNWVIDTSIGLGYVHREYDSYKWYPPANDDRGLGLKKKNGLGLTNLSVSLAYRFKL